MNPNSNNHGKHMVNYKDLGIRLKENPWWNPRYLREVKTLEGKLEIKIKTHKEPFCILELRKDMNERTCQIVARCWTDLGLKSSLGVI